MINFKVDPKRFEILKENYIRYLKNFAADQPHEHARYYLKVLLTEHVCLKDELLDSTTYLSVERLQWFIPQLYNKVHVECIIHGNVTKLEAIDIVKLIESKLINNVSPPIPLLQRQLVLNREIKLEDGKYT
ncbi:insulin-degrading enzyme-like [Pogonomyrmex barbatus]|uniref:Insulin-degrading enzyme-like n=1 Tax=Pogonomyrmex barbatus TaxID=144034 RepID=A0A6I9W4L6_9HYME|nr:insulin-degrading enzyme-like [Pogonomyrmex barbatus]